MTTVIATLFVLGIMIFVHELGHFLVAKWVGIRVERFSLGFPPKMFGKKFGDTEYCISWIPLGGYVKMAGEIPDKEQITGAPDEFMSKTIGQRTAVIIAGPLANLLTAIVICWAMFYTQGKPVIEINLYESELTPLCRLSLQGPSGVILPAMVDIINERRS